MSSINSIGQGVSQFLQSVKAPGPRQAQLGGVDSDGDRDGSTSSARGTARDQGGSPLFKQIEAAVTSALQASKSTAGADPNQVIEKAIVGVLTKKTAPTASQSTAIADGDGDGDTDAPGKTDSDSGPSRQAFFQMLNSVGVDPGQFRQDLLAAMQEAQGGQANPGTAFQSFPPGTVVNTTA